MFELTVHDDSFGNMPLFENTFDTADDAMAHLLWLANQNGERVVDRQWDSPTEWTATLVTAGNVRHSAIIIDLGY